MRCRMTRSAGAWRNARLADVVLPAAGSTVGGAVALGRDALAAAGCPTARLDAELLLSSAMGVGRERLVMDRDLVLDPVVCERFCALLARRVAHEPVAYILGRRDFRHLTLAVDPRVLIPRPETELLVEVGLELDPGARVIDVGTGSGAVALALKQERPDLDVMGLDVSPDALEVARSNAAALGLDVAFLQGDLLEGAWAEVGTAGKLGLGGAAVLANLPYVADGAELEPDIVEYEPAGALFAGADGVDLVRRLVEQVAGGDGVPGVAGRPSLVALEIGPEQAAEVSRLVGEAGFASVEVRRDLAGLERVVVGSS
jgi:release factor glutamine methyltransferase